MATSPWTSVLRFWFDEAGPKRWFAKDPQFDALVRTRLADLHDRATAGALDGWAATGEGALALVILLDQAPRNIFRDQARAFATDARALDVAERAIAARLDGQLSPEQRRFLYMPFMHAEDRAAQDRSVVLFRALGDAAPFAVRHRDIIQRFGRFPHRNAILGRASTAAETEFLREPGSSF